MDKDKLVDCGRDNMRNIIALVIDANYHTAISKALSTADKILDVIDAAAALRSHAPK